MMYHPGMGEKAIAIRTFRPGDQAAARALILAGLAERWGELDETKNPDLDDIAASYAAGVFLVAERAGELVGTGALVPEAPGVGRIVRMSVAQSQRRQGIGGRILRALLARAVDLGYGRIVLETTATWADAVNFYRKHGFRPGRVADGDLHFVLELG